MLDIRFIRENPELVRENIKKKFQDAKLPLVDEVLELDEKKRAAITEASELRAQRNTLSKQVGMLMGQAKKDPSKLEEAEAIKAKVKAQAERLADAERAQEIAEQVYYLICRLLCSCATKFLFWSVFQNPEWSASLLCTLFGHVLPSFGFIDRFAVLKLKDLLHIRLEFLPYFRAGGKIIVDNFLFAEAGNHRG